MHSPAGDLSTVRKAAWRIFAVALAARLLVFAAGPLAQPSRAITEDSSHYLVLTENLLSSGRFGAPISAQTAMHRLIGELRTRVGDRPQETNGVSPESFRTPGYPLFIATTSLGLRDLRLVLLAQCALGALSAAMVVLLAVRLGMSERAATVAGLLWALHPALVLFDNLLLTEALFNFCIVGATALAAMATASPALSAAGLLLGVASLVRPPLGLMALPLLVVLPWRRVPRRAIAASVLCAVTVPALWAVRNMAVGEGLRVSTVADYSLIFYTAPCVLSESAGQDCDRTYAQRHAELAQRLERDLKPGDDVIAVARRNAAADVIEHPAALVKMSAKSLVKLAVAHSTGSLAALVGLPYQSSGLFSRLVLRENTGGSAAPLTSVLLALAWTLFNAVIAAGAAWGLFAAVRGRRWDLLVGFGLPLVLLAATVGAVGQERIRLPMMLGLVIFNAVAVDSIWRRAAAGNAAAAAAVWSGYRSAS